MAAAKQVRLTDDRLVIHLPPALKNRLRDLAVARSRQFGKVSLASVVRDILEDTLTAAERP